MKKILAISAAVIMAIAPASVYASSSASTDTSSTTNCNCTMQSGERKAPPEFRNGNGSFSSTDRPEMPTMDENSDTSGGSTPPEMNGQRPEPPSMDGNSDFSGGNPPEMNGQRPEMPNMGGNGSSRPTPPNFGSASDDAAAE